MAEEQKKALETATTWMDEDHDTQTRDLEHLREEMCMMQTNHSRVISGDDTPAE